MRYFQYILGLLFFVNSLIFSQDLDNIIETKVLASADKFKREQSHKIAIALKIKKPYHINSNTPTESYLIPTTLNFNIPENVTFGRIEYPEAQLKEFNFSEKPLAVYEGDIYIFTSLSISEDFVENNLVISGNVSFQACDDQACLAPAKLEFKKNIDIVPASETISKLYQDIFFENTPQEKIKSSENIGENIVQKGLFLTFILVFVGGLALNLTPCVYPLIPITISIFGGQAGGKKGSIVSHAMLYILGMAITYSILGMIAAFTGGLFGAALQNPLTLIAIAVILVALALSMFDLYEIRVPTILANLAGGSHQGYFGSFFMGLTVGILAAPCIGPFVLALLTYVGEKGDLLLGFSLFFVLALGMGLPFLFLAIFSGQINRLPRSGGWMIWVRAIFGFVLIIMAVYFLSPLFSNTLQYYFTMALILLIGGIYMAWIEPTKVAGKFFPAVRLLTGVGFFFIALYLATTGVQSYIEFKLNAAQIAGLEEKNSNKIAWIKYDEVSFLKLSEELKPVMFDFYADWCIPCKELDKFTFSNSDIIALSKNFIMIKVDLTKSDNAESLKLKEKFDIKGVPTLVFLSPEGKEIPGTRVVGFMEKDSFLPIMEKAIQASK